MSAHRIAKDLFKAPPLLDPGSGGTINVDRSPCSVALVSAAAEARTLARPTVIGALLTLFMHTDGGDITLTVTGGYNEDGDTTFTFDDPGEFAVFVSAYDGTNYFWRLVSSHATGVLTQTEAGYLEDVTAGTGAASKALVLDANGVVTLPASGMIDERNAEVVITTNVIAATENGRTYYLDLAAGFTSTLPAPAIGLKFKFVVKTAPTGAAYVITTNAGANVMYGMMVERAGGAGVAGAARDTFNFIHTQAIIGDWVEFWSDGTNWYYHGMVDVAAGNTVAAT